MAVVPCARLRPDGRRGRAALARYTTSGTWTVTRPAAPTAAAAGASTGAAGEGGEPDYDCARPRAARSSATTTTAPRVHPRRVCCAPDGDDAVPSARPRRRLRRAADVVFADEAHPPTPAAATACATLSPEVPPELHDRAKVADDAEAARAHPRARARARARRAAPARASPRARPARRPRARPARRRPAGVVGRGRAQPEHAVEFEAKLSAPASRSSTPARASTLRAGSRAPRTPAVARVSVRGARAGSVVVETAIARARRRRRGREAREDRRPRGGGHLARRREPLRAVRRRERARRRARRVDRGGSGRRRRAARDAASGQPQGHTPRSRRHVRVGGRTAARTLARSCLPGHGGARRRQRPAPPRPRVSPRCLRPRAPPPRPRPAARRPRRARRGCRAMLSPMTTTRTS